MKITIFGASSRTGRYIVEGALAAGHSVTALTRSPEKLGLQHPSLKIIQGDIQEGEVVEQAVAGAEAVISALGPTQFSDWF